MDNARQLPQSSRNLESQTIDLKSILKTPKYTESYKLSSTNLGRQLVQQNLRVSFAPAEQLETIHTVEKVETSPELAIFRGYAEKLNWLQVKLETKSIVNRLTLDKISLVEKDLDTGRRALFNMRNKLPQDEKDLIQSRYMELIQKSNDVLVEIIKLRQSINKP